MTDKEKIKNRERIIKLLILAHYRLIIPTFDELVRTLFKADEDTDILSVIYAAFPEAKPENRAMKQKMKEQNKELEEEYEEEINDMLEL